MSGGFRRLPLQRLYNARDLGGYPTKNGGMTKFGVFIRCEAPKDLPSSDLKLLKEYGIRNSVDFRGDREVERQPSDLSDIGWMRYFRSPAFNEQVAFGTRETSGGVPPVTTLVDWARKYAEMADDCKGWVRKTLEILDRCEGAVLFHCTTGKDRTGMISALLLGLADVPEDDITADYCVSEVYLKPVYMELQEAFMKHWPTEFVSLTDPFFRTSPANMTALLAHFRNNYGDIGAYLADCGVSAAVAARLKKRLTGE